MYYKIQSLLYKIEKLTLYDLLNELKHIIDVMPAWQEKGSDWLIAHPSKRMIAINALGITEEELSYVDYLIDNNKSIKIVLADENEDDSIITICYKNTPAVSSERYLLSIMIKQLSNNNDVDSFISVIDEVIKCDGWFFKYILLDTEQYRFNQRDVFDDRLLVGWMLYLLVRITYADA
ncbi:hypothetical protein ACF3VQ_03415 [Yersinia sp. HM-2024]|uniref:hypothetical protein n=1 Tax=Yersinia sp. HM-2024 TaxID=3344550 RepID=UPI00370D6BA7